MATGTTVPATVPTSVRVLAVDVDRFRRSRAGLVRLLRETRPDVALLHRVPTHPFSGHRVGGLASDVGLVVAVSGRDSAGAAVLTSLRLSPDGTEALAGPGGGMALATLRLTDGRRLRAATVTTRGGDADQAGVAAHLLALLGPPDDVPTVVAGDLPGTAGGDALARRLDDLTPGAAPTAPAGTPRTRPRGLLGHAATVRQVALPGAIGARPDLLGKVVAERPVVVDLLLS
ncbi:hypothetical protein [Aquipuribacter sp. SD81]|uniref:hypothetical protein n=1 Tax=Aquipuribacter sp. SD81 TaxID=3127703 RepID=UPI0030168D37